MYSVKICSANKIIHLFTNNIILRLKNMNTLVRWYRPFSFACGSAGSRFLSHGLVSKVVSHHIYIPSWYFFHILNVLIKISRMSWQKIPSVLHSLHQDYLVKSFFLINFILIKNPEAFIFFSMFPILCQHKPELWYFLGSW